MILQSLVNYYEGLMVRGELAPAGWSTENVSYALELASDGSLVSIVSLKWRDGKKMVPQKMRVPTRVGRTSTKTVSNFMCDNAKYFLGYDNKDPIRARKCFQAAAQLHEKLLWDVEDDAVRALLNFFARWDVTKVGDHPQIQPYKEDLLKGKNLIFSYNGTYLQDLPGVQEVWQRHLLEKNDDLMGRCMVTGKEDQIAVLHPSVKGIRAAKPSGASLVSYNAPAFCSFGKDQGRNAPVSEYAANAYGEALKHLIENMSFKQYIGDTAVLCYALDGNDCYGSAFDEFLFGADGKYTEAELNEMIRQLCEGKCVEYDQEQLDPDMKFYILGIAPNAARLSVRFFLTDTFGMFVENIRLHQKRLAIDRGNRDSEKNIPVYSIFAETYGEGRKGSPVLAGELVRSIINNTYYPATLINAIDVRIRADHKINDVRAAIIKAYYIKNKNPYISKEVLTVGLNKEAKDTAYNLGRLFAVLEGIQKLANPGISATIKDKFFGSASAIPATTFPNLINLAQKHLRKIDGGLKVRYEKQLGEIMGNIEDFPATLNMPQRGAFQLGYYHQIQELYKKSEKKEEQ